MFWRYSGFLEFRDKRTGVLVPGKFADYRIAEWSRTLAAKRLADTEKINGAHLCSSGCPLNFWRIIIMLDTVAVEKNPLSVVYSHLQTDNNKNCAL
jgi:hypothetical protein